MNKLMEQVKKELTEIGEKGMNASNLELISNLTEIYKDLSEIKAMEEGGQYMQGYGGNYGNRGDYRDSRYNDRGYSGYMESGYGRSGGGRYNNRMREHITHMMDGMDQYEYGKDRYQHSGDESRVYEGLEKLMYALCMFVESTMDFAETPQEREIIRKHIQKISRI